MTEVNQDFSIFAGETRNIIVPNTKQDGSPLDLTGATIKWTVMEQNKLKFVKDDAPRVIFTKESPEITVADNVLTIPLKPPDTETLKDTYYHKCECTDQQGNHSVLFTGTLTIEV